MTVPIDQDVSLGEKSQVRGQGSDWRSKSYPFQIPMYHFLIMHVYQPPSDTFELLGGLSMKSTAGSRGKPEVKPYKFESIGAPVGLDKLVDVPIFHPFRHHDELVLVHRHSQQW